MRFSTIFTAITFVTASVSGACWVGVANETQNLTSKVVDTLAEVSETQTDIAALRDEYETLSSGEELSARMATSHLQLGPVRKEQIVSEADLNSRLPELHH